MRAPEGSCSSRSGSDYLFGKGNDGPRARITTFLSCVPVTMNPPIRTSSPPPTRSREERLPRTVAGLAVGVEVAVAVLVGVGVSVAGGVDVLVGVGVAVAAAVAVGVDVAVAVAVAVGVIV